MSNPSPAVRSNRVERLLAVMAAAIVALAIVAIAAVIIGQAAGMQGEDFRSGIWTAVLIFPLLGFPIGIALIIAYLIVSAGRRGRQNRQERS